MKRTLGACALLLFGGVSLPVEAWTIRAGLLQAEQDGWNGMYWTEGGADVFEASIVPVAHVPGPVMADWTCDQNNCDSTPYVNPWSGEKYYWKQFNSSWIYKGEMYLEAGRTYYFGEHGDSYNVMDLNSQTLFESYDKSNASIGSFTPETTGWYPVRFGVYNADGVKGPARGEWGNAGFAFDSKFQGDYWNKGWIQVRDPGDISFLRSTDPNEQIAEIAKVERTATGYKVTVRILNHGYGTVSGGLSAEPQAVQLGGTLEGFAAVSSVTTTGKDQLAVLTFDWAAETTPYITILASGRGDTVSDGFIGCNTPLLLDDALYAANRRTLTVTEVKDASDILTGFDISVAADGDGASVNTLVAAYGSHDYGDYIGNWPTLSVVAKLQPATASVTHFDVPAGWGETVFHLRFFVCSDDLGPYRAQVEYLKSNGKSTIADLGFRFNHDTKLVPTFTYPVRGGGAGFIGAGPDANDRWYKYVANYTDQYIASNGSGGQYWVRVGGALGDDEVKFAAFGDPDYWDPGAWAGKNHSFLGDETIDAPCYLMSTTDYGKIIALSIGSYATGGEVASYVPVIGWNGHTGLYETYSETIYYSTLDETYTEDFEAGPVVSTGSSYLACEAISDDFSIAVPWIDTIPTVTTDAQGGFVLNGRLDTGTGSVTAHYSTRGLAVVDQVVFASETGPKDFSVPVCALASDRTYGYSVESSGFGVTHEVAGQTCFYTGALTVSAVQDADHCGAVSGRFRITRADTSGDLVVNVSFGGTAEAGTEFAAPAATAVIADGAQSVDIDIVPLDVTPVFEAKTITLTVEPGLYGHPAAPTAQIALKPYIEPQPSRCLKMVDIAFTGYTGAPLANFPVLVRLGDHISGFDYAMLRDDHADLRFADFEGHELDYEVETWDKGGVSSVWVNVPNFYRGGKIRMYFCRQNASPKAATGAVWTKGGYYGVWHLDEGFNTGDAVIVDAARRSANGLANTTSATESGVVGYGHRVSDGGRYASDGHGLLIPDTNGSLDCDTEMTYSAWVKYPDHVFGWDRIGSRKTAWNDAVTWEICCQENWNNYWVIRGAGTDPAAGPWTVSLQNTPDWMLLHFVFDGGRASVYVNGDLAYQFSAISPVGKLDGRPLGIGNNAALNDNSWQGWIDEVRLQNAAVTPDRAKADYQTVADRAFVTYGAVEKGESAGFVVIVR